MSLQTEPHDRRFKSLQDEVQTLRSLVRCPICLDTMINPVRTKCDHGFCRLCLEKWICEKGKRGKVACPSCQAGGVTKRSLTEDVVMGKLVVQIRKAFSALNEDTSRQHELNFFLTTEAAPPPPPSTPAAAAACDDGVGVEGGEVRGETCTSTGDERKKSPLVDLVDDYTAKMQRENNKSPPPESLSPLPGQLPRSTPSSPSSSPALTNPRPPVWYKQKASGVRTYGAYQAYQLPDYLEFPSGLSPPLPGEEVEVDKETERRLALPLVGASRGSEKVDWWLSQQRHEDLNSQPTASQSSVSTPMVGRGRTESIRSLASPLSPICLNQQNSREVAGSLARKIEGIVPRKDTGDDQLPSQSLQDNFSVDFQNTFDKLFTKSDMKRKKKDSTPTPSLGDPPPAKCYYTNGVTESQILSLERSRANQENCENNAKTLNEKNIGNTMAMDFEDDINFVNDVSIGNLLDWESQEKERTEVFETPSLETNSKNTTAKETPVKKLNVRRNVPFSLVGKVAHSVKPPRDRVIQFLQLGRLASPRIRKYSLPSLRDIVEKKKLFTESLKSEEQGEEECENKSKESREEEEKSECPEIPGLLNPENSLGNVIQPARQSPTEEKDETSPPSSEDMPPLVRMEPSFPENRQPWLINNSIASIEENHTENQTDFMENILGNNPDVYTQDAETGQEMMDRLARTQIEEEAPAEQKRARSEDSDIEDIFSQSQRKVARIDSGSDSTESIFPATQQPVVERPKLKKTSRTVPLPSESGSSMQDSIDSETGEKMDTQQMEEKCRKAEMTAHKLRETLAGREEQEVFQREEESQPDSPRVLISDSESDYDLFSATPEKTPAVPPSQAPELSPVPERSQNIYPETERWKFVFSNLSLEEKNQCEELIEGLDCLGVSEKIDESVTHLIITTGDDLQAARTLKYLQAVASGVLIVSAGWVEACLQDRSNLARAEEWEVTDQELSGCNGPWRSRKRREEGRPPLLSGYEVMVEGDLAHLSSLAVNDLLSRVGARKVLSVNSFSFTRDITRIIIVNSAQCYGTDASRKRLKRERLAVVDKDWLLDSISSHSVKPLEDFTAGITDKELTRAGYSAPLVLGST